MASTKTGNTSATPNTSGSSQQKRRPATEVKNKGSATYIVGSDAGSSAPKPPFVPTNIWGPGGTRPTWTPRVKTDGTADARNYSDSRGSRPPAGTGPPRAKPAPNKTPPSKPVPAPPKPEEVPLGTGVKMEKQAVEEVERQTRGQRQNHQWHAWRQNRITASIAHQVAHSRFVNGRGGPPPPSYLGAITGEKRGVKTRAMTWGIENEARAARQYARLKGRSLGRAVRVRDCGLFLHPEHSWLGASPDGIVEDADTGERLLCLEIKCPYKHRERTVAEACEDDRQFCLEPRPEAGEGEPPYRLKTKHTYYTQVQCQMAVVGLHKADFVVFTLRDVAIVPVTFDPDFWSSTLEKLEIFYGYAVLPHLEEKGKVAPILSREE